MTTDKASTVSAFLRGEEASASRFETSDIGGVPVLLGYGWAVYAADLRGVEPGPDAVVLFGDGYASDRSNIGWAGYSPTTTTHVHDIKAGVSKAGVPLRVADARPVSRTRNGQGRRVRTAGDLATLAEENAEEVQDTARYYYQQP